VTRAVLREIGAEGVPSRLVMNKVDRLTPEQLEALTSELPEAWFLSAKRPADVAELRTRLLEFFESSYVEAELLVPYTAQRLLSEMHELGRVVSTAYEDEGTRVLFRADPEVLDSIRAQLA
jgi:GTP-binding protein HflX